MAKIILYMPTPTTDLLSYIEYGDQPTDSGGLSTFAGHRKNHQWIEYLLNTKNKEAIQIWYEPKTVINELKTISNDDQIYIRGHGEPGSEYIKTSKGGKELGHRFVVDRLRENGLPKSFRGKIKCYNCNSGSWLNGKRSFAQALADYMYGWGYDKCTYYGYRGKLDSYYKQGTQGVHKYIREGAWDVNQGICRARDGRVQIKPQALNPTQWESLSG
ncbi:hypothetical protein HOP38_21575 [Vibrio mediterranei]|uniref:hypothetical protein n=1 Tax=Vibrio mediterranei TaxID=689 RepID=UPI0018590561|nr:hypothetical protein [Vibrio mediterranei]NUW75095.1 hypothetical protein [Vibrio mediterranei]